MIWLIWALVSAFSDGIKRILHRVIMIDESPYSYALIENILTSFVFIPILITEFTIPSGIFPWLLVLFSSFIWTIIALVGFNAYKFTPISLKEPISQSRLIFLLILSIILLSEIITFRKILGTLIIFIGIIILTYHKKRIFGRLSDKGVQLTFISAFLFAFVNIIDKTAMRYFTAGMFGFLVYLIPGLLLLLFIKKRTVQTKKLIKNKWNFILFVIILGAVFYYSKLKAYTLADVSLVFPIIRMGTLISVLGGILFLNEKEEIFKKVLSSVIIMIGVITLIP